MRAALKAIALAICSGALDAYAGESASSDESARAQEPPLVAYSLELIESESKLPHSEMAELRAINFEMSRHPPPKAGDCAHTLGASRFADQYARLASIQFALGDYQASIDADEWALACTPRDASLHASIASANLSLGRITEARAAIERGYAIDRDNSSVQDVRARIDFLQERWADATARFRLEIVSGEARDFADYDACFLWLAQRRAGVLHPDLPPPPADDEELNTRKKRWPTPILALLKGELTEAALVQAIRDDAAGNEPRERLTEALYYVGELRLAEGDVETARKHFASVRNLRVLNFVEFGMARAELARMRERSEALGKEPAGR
jgi:tetratricopeptide (TPR) repeat protein